MTDIVKVLRGWAEACVALNEHDRWRRETLLAAADEIERLRERSPGDLGPNDGPNGPLQKKARKRKKNMLTITLPLPAEILHPNGRTRSYMKRARAVKKARGEARLVACILNRNVGTPARVTVQATFYMPRRRDGDGLNSWIKSYLDGLQDAGIVVNDSGILLLPPKQVTGAKIGERRVVLEVQES